MSLVYYSGGGDSRRHLRRGSDSHGGEQMAHAAPLVARLLIAQDLSLPVRK